MGTRKVVTKKKTPVINIRRKTSNKVDERIDITLLRQELKDTQHKVDSHATFYNMHTQQIALLTRIANEQHSALMSHAEILEIKTGMRPDVEDFAQSMSIMMESKTEELESDGKNYESANDISLIKEYEDQSAKLVSSLNSLYDLSITEERLNEVIKRSIHTANYCMMFFTRANKMLEQLELTEKAGASV